MSVKSGQLYATRRGLLQGTAALAAFAAAPAVIGRAGAGTAAWAKGNPFALGVAAGDPAPDGFVIWTRLAPEPLSSEPGTPGGMSGPDVPVAYEIAKDPAFKDGVRKGEAPAEADYAYSVHVELNGLEPGRPYWYRFTSGDAQSRTGRAMTAPAPGAPLARMRFGFVSCSHYEHGYFSAYRHLADEQPDLVAFLGDYIYEYVESKSPVVRHHSDGVDAHDLRTYRNRYAQYRTDPDLQRLHAEVPALMTWDDHEVQNDYADTWNQTFDDRDTFLKRRAAAYQAYYEHMPLRPSLSRPAGPNMRIYDRFTFGDLAQFSVLDGRQYRSKPACYGPGKKGRGHLESNKSCPERLDESRSMLGLAQEAWLRDGLAASKARWNIVAQDVLMAELRQKMDDGDYGYWTDDWNGFPASRARLLKHIHEAKIQNVAVLSGDIHAFFQNDLKLDFGDPASPTAGAEFMGTSITSPPAPFAYDLFTKLMPDNPHIKFFESRHRGYVSVDLTHERCTARYQIVSDEKDPEATVSTLKTFAVENGRPGAVET
ncbi:MAG: alkaline phosphatase D family protein [Rhodomicrobium sp.]